MSLSLDEAARALHLTVRSLRRLIRDGVVSAHKVGRRWIIESADLATHQDSVSQALLHAHVTRERLSRDDIRAIEEGRMDALSGKTKSFDEIRRQYLCEID